MLLYIEAVIREESVVMSALSMPPPSYIMNRGRQKGTECNTIIPHHLHIITGIGKGMVG